MLEHRVDFGVAAGPVVVAHLLAAASAEPGPEQFEHRHIPQRHGLAGVGISTDDHSPVVEFDGDMHADAADRRQPVPGGLDDDVGPSTGPTERVAQIVFVTVKVERWPGLAHRLEHVGESRCLLRPPIEQRVDAGVTVAVDLRSGPLLTGCSLHPSGERGVGDAGDM